LEHARLTAGVEAAPTPRGIDRLGQGLATGLPLFWGSWLAVVTASNVTNALSAAGLVRRPPFASSNFELIEATTALYHPPRALLWVLFLGVITWEAMAALLYLRAARAVSRGAVDAARAMTTATAAGMGLFAAFMLADELCIAYALQGGHMRAFAAQGVSFLVVRSARGRAGARNDS
jgi:hypothetical protein